MARSVDRAPRTEAEIQATARKRQDAWAEGGQQIRTGLLTSELEHLFDELRKGHAEAYAKGEMPRPKFDGRTSQVGR